ncbi:unnamed protein product [Moneuplotes crassus]|uniref:Uncharacterized protein n=1 Tax=Euplotes crassus TaxID=5936 RepID=A0AAD1URP1_EUPCR|nr:unnamed protein product [Moneuplotes crassus]
MEIMRKPIKEKNSQAISVEKYILAETKEQDKSICENILYKHYLRQIEFKSLDSNSKEVSKRNGLYIHFTNPDDLKLSRSFKNLKFFDINQLTFDGVESKNMSFVEFLEFSFPDKTNQLYFGSCLQIDLNRSNYFKPLVSISTKVIQRVFFAFFRIGLPQLKRLLAAYKHVRVFGLQYCKLSIPNVPDLSKALINCQIQKLDLLRSGESDLSDWESNLDQFKNMIQGLSSSPDLRLSLTKVSINSCEVNQDEAEQIFEENQLGEVEIIGGS